MSLANAERVDTFVHIYALYLLKCQLMASSHIMMVKSFPLQQVTEEDIKQQLQKPAIF